MYKKVFLVGLNLYSIFLSLKIKSNFKNINVTIIEGSNNFLKAYNHLKIGKYLINPGFHTFEDIRSKSLLNFLNKNIKFKKIKKTRGMIIDKNIISCQDKYAVWPKEITQKFKLKNKMFIYSKKKDFSQSDMKFVKYLKNCFSDERTSIDNAIGVSYPWFFPPNYKLSNKDEASIFNQRIRDRKINHTYVFPKGGLFENISKSLKKLLIKNDIKIKLNTPLKFYNQKKNIYFEGYDELNKSKNFKIICIPIKPLSLAVAQNQTKVKKIKKLEPIKYYTGLVEIKNFIKSDLDKFTEIITASQNALGLKRISLYSDVFDIKGKKIYQIEFLEHKKIKDIEKQISNILLFMSKFVKFNDKKNLKKDINLIGFCFVRNTFAPRKNDLKSVTKKMINFFENKEGIIFPRQILWPINSNKHFIYANEDYNNNINKRLI